MKTNAEDLNVILLLTSEKNEDNAQNLCQAILHSKLGACVSLNNINSFYWWDGVVQDSCEVQITVKTNRLKLEKLIALIKELHSYELPEILYWNVSADQGFKDWINKSIDN